MSDNSPAPEFGTAVRVNQNKLSGACEAPVSTREERDFVATPASWAVMGDKLQAVPETTTSLPPGFYRCVDTPKGPMFQTMNVRVDSLIDLPDETTDMLLKEFVTFWEKAGKYAEKGLSAKRGIMLWGPPGSGKTSAVQKMASHMIQQLRGVVVVADIYPPMLTDLLHDFRSIEPTRPLIVIFEDIDALVDQYGEANLLALLDGENQIANVVNVATTNYPERLDRRFADRPGRFDRVQYVGMPKEDARRTYFKARMPDIDELRLERWVKKTDGWSIAHLRELVVATEVLGDDDADTISRVDGMRETPRSEEAPDRKSMGFG